MKKKYFIIFMFLILFNVNSVYAKETYYFEQNKFSTTNEFVTFYGNMCQVNPGLSSCHVVCKSGTKGSVDTSGFPTPCSDIEDVKKFRVSKGDFSYTKNILNNQSCGEGIKCWKYVSVTYCKNYKNAKTDSNYYKLCSKIKNEVSDSTGGDTKTCSFVFNPTGNANSIAFNITILKDNKKILFAPAEHIVNGNDIILEDTYFKGYSNIINFYEKGSDFNSFTSEYIKAYSDSGKCPAVTFCLDDFETLKSGKAFNYTWYTTMKGDSECKSDKYKEGHSQSSQNGDTTGIDIEIEDSKAPNLIDKNKPIKFDCDTLFHSDENGEYLFDMIKLCINLIKVFVPIALLGFGMLDMAKATLSGDEEKMRKVQSKFILRIVIAVGIFLIPSILKLLLTIGHSVWNNISPDFCGLL